MTYIRGGSPPGNPGVNHRGCRCKREPQGDVPVRLPQSLYFAGQSRGWGGGAVAFITVCAGDTPTLARAYLIQRDQFKEVVWQENGENDWASDVSLPIEGARRGGHARMLEKGFYSELVHCGERDGFPMLSFTASRGRWSECAKPSAAYLLAIAEGLRERYGFDVGQCADYLIGRPGVDGNYTTDELAGVLQACG